MRELYIDNTTLIQDKKFTYLSADVSSGDSTLTVQSIVGFAINQILCVEEVGEEKEEIIKTHATTAPSGTTVTLASTLTFDHPQDTKVYLINWDQIEISWASTATGSKTTLDTIAIQADQLETLYKETAKSSGFYFTRFKETIGNTYSDYGDAIPYAGYAEYTVFMIKKRALGSIGEEISESVTHEFLNEALWEARREYHNAPGKRPFRKKFNSDIGNVVTGTHRIAIPADLQDPYTAENIFGVRIGTEENMDYYTKKDYDEDYQGAAHTTVATQASAADTSITLNDTRDFDESGSFYVGTQTDAITYTANAESTGVLSGIPASGDGSISATIAVDKDVWQGIDFGLPSDFTVFTEDGTTYYIYFNCPISSDYVDQNIWCDYYRTLVAYDSDADELDEPEYDMYVNYLAWRIKKRKNEGLVALTDNDYLLWIDKKTNALNTEYLGQEVSMIPDVEHLPLAD